MFKITFFTLLLFGLIVSSHAQLTIDLNPDKDNSKAIQGKMNLREYYESLGN